MKKDTLIRPADMSRNATLLNLGSDQEPILTWGDYIGPLCKNGKKFAHIHGVRFCSTFDYSNDTTYYENIAIRQGKSKFSFDNVKIPQQVMGCDLLLINAQDSITLFPVLELEDNNDNNYKNAPAIKPSAAFHCSGELHVNIKKGSDGIYKVTYLGAALSPIAYKIHGSCNEETSVISFINREDGKIYFLDKDCYLYPINDNDIKILKQL